MGCLSDILPVYWVLKEITYCISVELVTVRPTPRRASPSLFLVLIHVHRRDFKIFSSHGLQLSHLHNHGQTRTFKIAHFRHENMTFPLGPDLEIIASLTPCLEICISSLAVPGDPMLVLAQKQPSPYLTWIRNAILESVYFVTIYLRYMKRNTILCSRSSSLRPRSRRYG